METGSPQYRIRPCFRCSGNKAYFCVSCQTDLCLKCKKEHVKDLKTIDHNVVICRDAFNYIQKQEISVKHPDRVCGKYCELCQIPDCLICLNHRKFIILYIRDESQKRKQNKIIHIIRSESLFSRKIFLTGIKADIKTYHTEFSLYQSDLLTKAQRLKDRLENELHEVDYKHSCLKQKRKLNRYIASIQIYEHIYEQSAISPVQFLKFKAHHPQIQDSPCFTQHCSQLSMTQSFNKEDVMDCILQISETAKKHKENERRLKLMPGPEIHQSFTIKRADRCHHISCVTSDQVCVSDRKSNLIFTNTTGETLHYVEDLCCSLYRGLHTGKGEKELLYIDRHCDIREMSTDLRKSTIFTKRIDSSWEPRCVHWSTFNGDILVGMYNWDNFIGKVTRYNKIGQLIQTIQHHSTGEKMFKEPNYIKENNNGDVVVSDYDFESGAVVVTERGGRHRFSYTGLPLGSGLEPRGICTDALSHILVCDDRTQTVHMIDKDGQFLSHLLIRPEGIFRPYSLGYDVSTHRLWVGSQYNNKLCVYRYITRQDVHTDKNQDHTELIDSQGEIKIAEIEKPQEENGFQLKLLLPPKINQYLSVTDVLRCDHISCVPPDQVWVSNCNTFILANSTGDTLHDRQDLCGDCNGSHTVNSDNELIYINKDYNIIKLSKDMKTTTTFLENTISSSWRLRCVYWSPSTGDLLFGMAKEEPDTGKIARYNQSGQLTQTIQCDNAGLELYVNPTYITENNNGDVVVSDSTDFFGAVVLTERDGRHKFSYKGHPSGSGLQPQGICTDAMSHILVCDNKANTVQMLDKNGQFLLQLLTKSQEMGEPYSLGYDVQNHRLWVGSRNNNIVCVYTYITQQDVPVDEHPHSADIDAMSSLSPV